MYSTRSVVAKAAAMRAHPAQASAARGPRRPPEPPVLPEWLTSGVGGWVREHPAGAAFGALIAVAVLTVGAALWERLPETFLANGRAGQPDEARQPILLSAAPEAGNGARFIALADGQWREEAMHFARAFLSHDER